MKNERGVTLVELLAVLAIFGVIMLVLGSIFIDGMKASDRNATNQRLQQEANYILESVRKEYLKRPEDVTISEIILKVEPQNGGKTLKLNDETISEGFTYELGTNTILRESSSSHFNLTIKKNGKSYTIDTTLSKLN